MKTLKFLLLMLLLFVGAASCDDEMSNKYTGISAHFSYSPVNAVPTLYRACNSLGEFCSITVDGNNFYFQSPGTSADKVARTAVQGYTGFVLGLGGLILGRPNMPEIGQYESSVICYDLNCPNCYKNYNITKRLVLKEGGYAACSSTNGCKRVYDLNNQGIVSSEDAGRALFRYAVYFDGTTVNVNNN